MRVKYLHSDIDTVERMKIIRSLRHGEFDVLVGINLLREGLDLPEVSLIAILDADREGFLRSTTSLVQIIGRAARNVHGQVVMYADKVTDSMQRAIDETNRRRSIQEDFNKKHGIIPVTIKKDVRDVIDTVIDATEEIGLPQEAAEDLIESRLEKLDQPELEKLAAKMEKDMKEAARQLEFEEAAQLRDLLIVIRGRLRQDA